MLKREEGKEGCEVGEREGEKEERRERKERGEKGQEGKESITTCCRYIYCISSIRCCSYYFFPQLVFVPLLFKGDDYFFENPQTLTMAG